MQSEYLIKEIQQGLLKWYDFKPNSTFLYLGEKDEPCAALLSELTGQTLCMSAVQVTAQTATQAAAQATAQATAQTAGHSSTQPHLRIPTPDPHPAMAASPHRRLRLHHCH